MNAYLILRVLNEKQKELRFQKESKKPPVQVGRQDLFGKGWIVMKPNRITGGIAPLLGLSFQSCEFDANFALQLLD